MSMKELTQRDPPLVIATSGGLYCPAGDFYIDPSRGVERALITHAHGDHARWGSAAYWAAEASVSLLHHRLGAEAIIHGMPYGRRFQMGEATVSFHPAGHILGSAQIRIEAHGQVWVMTGDYKRGHDPTCEPFEVVPCDVLITEATFALPVYRWESGARVAEEILTWWHDNREEGRTSILFCYALGKAQRILAELAQRTDRTVYLHGALEDLTRLYREAGVPMLPAVPVSSVGKPSELKGELVLAPPSAYRSPWMKRFKEFETGFASGWMRIRAARRRSGYDRGFVMSDHADWPELLQTIRDSGAGKIYATHGTTHALVRYLQEQGVDAESLTTSYRGEEGADVVPAREAMADAIAQTADTGEGEP